MSDYCVKVVLFAGDTVAVHEHVGNHGEACRKTFQIADAVSEPTPDGEEPIQWVSLYDGDHFELSIQIIPGVGLAGEVRQQSRPMFPA